MSVAPFLPGLVAPAPDAGTTGTASGTSTDAQPGTEGDSAFLDALAAALAVLPGAAPPPAPAAAPAAAPAPAGTPAPAAAPAGAPAAVTAELGFVTPELELSTAELGFVTAEMALDPELAVAHERPSSTAAGVSARPTGEPAVTTADLPAPIGATTTTSLPSQPRELAVHADAAATSPPADVPASRSTAPTPGLDPVTIPNSSVETPNSAVTNPNSAVETPNSGVTNPKSVERAVVQQVFPEVTRLVSSGNGTHRITLTLQPEQLGEVRVTLVVRDGTVRVRMSGEAGDGAVRAALANGAPELQRMLERAGATEARVLVRDAITPASMPSSPVQAARQDAGATWSGSSDQFSQADQFSPSSQSDQSRGEGRPGRPGHLPGHPDEPAGRPAAAAGVVPASTPTAGRLDRNL